MAALADEIKVIDTDTHVIEPYDLWTSRVSTKRWGDLVPHVRWNDDLQEEHWYFGDTPIWQAAGSAMAGYDKFPPNHPKRWEDAHPSTWDAKLRLERMDEYGIYAQVLYPNVSGFGMGRFTNLQDPELMLACVQAYNDFLVDFSSADPKRFIPVMALPFWDVEASLAEIDRCTELGHRGIIMGSQPEIFGQPPLAHPQWYPVFASAQEKGLPINFHIAAGDTSSIGSGFPGNGRHANYSKGSLLFFLGNANAISEVIISGLCHRFPELNFVSVESGVGWLPFALESLDWMWKNCGVGVEHPEYDLLPSEYFRRQIYGCFWFEQGSLRAALDQLGPDNILYETDFPHPTSMSPGPASAAVVPRDFIQQNLGDLPRETAQKILHDNAARLYGLDR
ncbi:MAG: amidohydrolase family protein [Acidimicrobiia bacterium]